MRFLQQFTKNASFLNQERHLCIALGTNVSRLRLEQALTKKTVSLMSGISRPLLNKIENGKSDVRLSYVERLADAFSVEPIELLLISIEEVDAGLLGSKVD